MYAGSSLKHKQGITDTHSEWGLVWCKRTKFWLKKKELENLANIAETNGGW